MYVTVLGDDGPLKITTYHVTWLTYPTALKTRYWDDI